VRGHTYTALARKEVTAVTWWEAADRPGAAITR